MSKDQTLNIAGISTRRTGLDRRWIPSTDHQPERRRGMDRRANCKKSFSESLALSAPEEKGELFPEIDAGTKRPASHIAALPFDRNGVSLSEKAGTKEKPSDNG